MEKLQLAVIEDDAIIGLDLKRRLTRIGISEVLLFSNALKALDHLSHTSCDLVLMDIGLPGEMDGVEAASLIRKRYNIPVVFVTGFADEATLTRARLAEPMGYILKPFKEHEIFATITIAVYKSQMERKLRMQQEMQGTILNHTLDGILTLNSTKHIRFINPMAKQLFGYSASNEESVAVAEISQDLGEICDSMAERTVGETKNLTNLTILSNSQHVVCDISITRVMLPGSLDEVPGYLIVIHDKTQLHSMEQQVAYHERHDRLTGLLNRVEFQKFIETSMEDFRSDGSPRGLIFIDIDKFTLINELHGHLVGDELLKYVAKKIVQFFPKSEGISRLGDDEFAIIFPTGGAEAGEEIAQSFLDSINGTKFTYQSISFAFSLTGGMSHFSKDIRNANILISLAIDANMLARQDSDGHFRSLTFQDEIFHRRRSELKWIHVLTEALEKDRFVLYFQPIVPLDSEKGLRNKVEILLRLRDEDGTIIPPIDFIPAAERYGMMHLIDRWVISHLLENYPEAVSNIPLDNPVFCINLSGASTLTTDLDSFIIGEIDKNQVPPDALCFEITETSAIQNMSRATNLIGSLREHGCSFALDDFGNGFSNFNYLRYLEVDYIKIDGSFVKNLDSDPVSLAMVEAIHRLSQSVKKQTIAEFVRSEEILNRLKTLGVDYGQGYAIGMPRELLGENS